MKTLLTLFILAFSINATAQIGLPDVNFGINGIAAVNLGPDDELFDLKVLPDGKILCLSKSQETGTTDRYPTVCRLNPDGSLDPSYATNGFIRLNDPVFLINYEFNLAIDNQQRAIVAASVGNEVVIYRLTASGSLDLDFSFDGKVTVDFGSGQQLVAGLALQSDGKIVMACTTDNDFGVARLNPDGTFDTSFGTNGKETYNVTALDAAYDLAVQDDGKILVCGTTDDGFGFWVGIIRIMSDGTLDASFNGDGKVTRIINGNDRPYAIAVQADGKIVVGGHTSVNTFDQKGFVLRYNSNGLQDNTFDADGLLEVNMSGATDFFTVLTMQPDGKILAGGIYDVFGSNNTQAWATRITTNGTLDTDFSNDGSTNISVPNAELYVEAIDLTPSGDVILGARDAGSTHNLQLIKLRTGLNIGINELDARSISSYPNPTFDVLNLNLSDFESGQKSIHIFDNAGKLVFESTTNSNTEQLDVTTLAPGNYSCIVTSKTEKASIQFNKN